MELLDNLLALRQPKQSRPSGKWLPLILVVAAVCAVGAFGTNVLRVRTTLLQTAAMIPPCLIVGLVLGLLPVLICLVQTNTRKRLLSKLESVESYPVAQTIHYMTAKNSVNTTSPAAINADYIMPFLVLFLLNLGGFMLIYGVYPDPGNFNARNLILGGMHVLDPGADLDIPTYQAGTFVIMAAAFIGSYVYLVGRLIERLSNNDLYPLSLYLYATRTIIAVMVAAVFRHAADAAYWNHSSSLILIAFATGLAPDLILLAMARKAFQSVKVMGNKKDPKKEARPAALPLIMIDDLTREKVERLGELGIDSAQVLACQNPFAIWLRLPYDVGLVVQWIATAQLYTLVKETSLLKLREIAILTVFDLRCRLDEAESAAQICDRLGVPARSAGALKVQLDTDPGFVRLSQVRSALNVLPPPRASGHSRPPAVHGPRISVPALEPHVLPSTAC